MASKSVIAIAELRAQAVAKEMERKQNLMRLKWFEQNYERVYMNPALPKEKVPKKAAELMEELRKMRKARFAEERKERTRSIQPERKVEGEYINLEVMYPVPAEVWDTLYQGVSHDEDGRYRYLKLRNQSAPDEKYRHKETSGFEYGWRVRETGVPPSKKHCRRSTWHCRVNGAFKGNDPLRRPPFPTGQISFPFI